MVRLTSNVSTVSKHVISDRGALKSWQGSTCLAKLMAGSSADGRGARSAAFVGLEVLAAGCRSDCGLNQFVSLAVQSHNECWHLIHRARVSRAQTNSTVASVRLFYVLGARIS